MVNQITMKLTNWLIVSNRLTRFDTNPFTLNTNNNKKIPWCECLTIFPIWHKFASIVIIYKGFILF